MAGTRRGEAREHERAECCRGRIRVAGGVLVLRSDDPTLLVHLGNHPEVALCRRWAAKQAREIDDRSKTGSLVIARDRFRNVRRAVVDRGWRHSRLFGGPLRWIRRRLP